MFFTSTSVSRPVTTIMLYVGLAFIGIYSFSRIGVDLLPNISIPNLIVQTNYPNATSEEVEKLITEPLESSAGTVEGVKNITSVSKEGLSVISIEFAWGTNMDYALLSLREKLDNVRFLLPEQASRPTIIRTDPSSTPVMTLILSYKRKNKNNISFVNYNSGYSDIKKLIDLKEAARVVFKRRLEQTEGVAQAVITGGLEREILVEADPQKLNQYNLTFEDIANALRANNVNLPAGSIMNGLFRYSLRTIGEYKNTDEIGKTILKWNSDGSVLKISDVAKVKESFKERDGLTRFNGAETVGLLIYKEPSANTVNIAGSVRKVVSDMQEEYPEYNLTMVSDHSKFIVNAIQSVELEIFFGGIFAFLTLFFFLKNLRNIFIIGITIPSSFVLVILLMFLFKISFNIISLGGIAVGVGMLLYNAIVVIENINRYKEEGLPAKEAAKKGANEVAMPVVAASLTAIAVFFPLIFIKGITGELFKDQSLAIIFSLSASIVTSITLIPMLASFEKFSIIKDKAKIERGYILFDYNRDANIFSKTLFWIKFPFKFLIKSIVYIVLFSIHKLSGVLGKFFDKFFVRTEKILNKVINKYDKGLLWSLRNRGKILSFTLILLLFAVFAAIEIKKEFIPAGPDNEFIIEIDLPKGSSLQGNSKITSTIEDAVLNINGVESVVSNIGRVNEFDVLNRDRVSVTQTNMIVKIFSENDYYNIQEKLRKMLGKVGGIKYTFKKVKTSFTQVINTSENDIAIEIKNKDLDQAFAKAVEIIDKINNSQIAGLSDVRLGSEKGEPEYRITIDRDRCIAYGLNVEDVSGQLVNLVKGNEATFFSDFDKKIGIEIRTAENKRDNLNKVISQYIIKGKSKIPIENLIKYESVESRSEIRRESQSRVVYIYANLSGSSIEKVVSGINNVISGLPGMPGEIITVGGVNEEIENSFASLYMVLLISFLLMYMILASEFESFVFPFIIIFAVPLGLIGGILALFIFGKSLSIISIIGLVILIGISDNDAVVKVEFILRKRREGIPLEQAIIEAGKQRFRPIVMTSCTIIFALIPMILGLGAGAQLRTSLSLAIAGGLVSSTLLTLFVIPVLYTYMEKLTKEFKYL